MNSGTQRAVAVRANREIVRATVDSIKGEVSKDAGTH